MTAPSAQDSAAQLKRLLAAIPELANDKPHRLAEIAARVGTDEATLSRDLRTLVTRCGDEPGGFIEGVQLLFDEETVQLRSSLLKRPMGLSRAELRALELGLSVIRQESTPADHHTVDGARERIRKAVAAAPLDGDETIARAVSPGTTEHDARWLKLLRSAISTHSKAVIHYRTPSASEVTERTIHPYGLVHAHGKWFAIAYCEIARELRVFRVDRMTMVGVVAEEAPVPDGFSLDQVLEQGRVMTKGVTETLRVSYSPGIARWISEREKGEQMADGSFVVEHPLADDDWAVRHVLQYGPDAEVLAPTRVRELVVSRLRAMLAPE
jgi:predicted DNA-binding transcriptional regulator YafY